MTNNPLYILLSGFYSLGVAVRHALYDQHLLPSASVSVPTICVGNLAVGGTGKTPMVEYIVRLLLQNGFHPAILSRGYKRKTHGFVLADHRATSLSIGDRLKKKRSPKGLPTRQWFHFLKKNFGLPQAVFYSVTPYIKILFGI